ncbi:hypothetical protein ACIO8G_00025 [Streptomyces sp. NPDC087219]|uniref:hypothetical protein n=1 Tax=Streptomyces sp. NPDC087219 TaxID=3365770 RepID=UPI00380FE51D
MARPATGAAFAEDFAATWRRADLLCRAPPGGRTVRTRHGDAMLLSEFLLTASWRSPSTASTLPTHSDTKDLGARP